MDETELRFDVRIEMLEEELAEFRGGLKVVRLLLATLIGGLVGGGIVAGVLIVGLLLRLF